MNYSSVSSKVSTFRTKKFKTQPKIPQVYIDLKNTPLMCRKKMQLLKNRLQQFNIFDKTVQIIKKQRSIVVDFQYPLQIRESQPVLNPFYKRNKTQIGSYDHQSKNKFQKQQFIFRIKKLYQKRNFKVKRALTSLKTQHSSHLLTFNSQNLDINLKEKKNNIKPKKFLLLQQNDPYRSGLQTRRSQRERRLDQKIKRISQKKTKAIQEYLHQLCNIQKTQNNILH